MMVRYLLDTNICIYISKKRPLEVYQRLSELSIGDVGMSLITFGELRFGAEKPKTPLAFCWHTLFRLENSVASGRIRMSLTLPKLFDNLIFWKL